jgi:predicted transcriptional regulator
MGIEVYDKETGEKIADLEGEYKVVKVFDKTNFVEGNNELVEKLDNSEKFVKFYSVVAPKLCKLNLSGKEMAIFLYLSANTSYIDCIAKHGNNKFINKNSIIEVLQISERTCETALKKLKEHGLVFITKTNLSTKDVYIINPFVFSRGDKVNKTIYELFKHTKDKFYTD